MRQRTINIKVMVLVVRRQIHGAAGWSADGIGYPQGIVKTQGVHVIFKPGVLVGEIEEKGCQRVLAAELHFGRVVVYGFEKFHHFRVVECTGIGPDPFTLLIGQIEPQRKRIKCQQIETELALVPGGIGISRIGERHIPLQAVGHFDAIGRGLDIGLQVVIKAHISRADAGIEGPGIVCIAVDDLVPGGIDAVLAVTSAFSPDILVVLTDAQRLAPQVEFPILFKINFQVARYGRRDIPILFELGGIALAIGRPQYQAGFS